MIGGRGVHTPAPHPLNLMPISNRTIGLGILTLAVLIILYLIWPYIVGFLAVVGAAQVYRVCRNRLGR